MSSYLEKPGAHLFGTHPGGLNTIGTVKAGREHCATFFNCLPEEVCVIALLILFYMSITFNLEAYQNTEQIILNYVLDCIRT